MEKKTEEKRRLFCLAGCACFYLFFCFCFGVTLGADSRGYMEMISAREPVYPLFLAAFRCIFGKDFYLWPVIVTQNLLAAFAAWYSTERLWSRFCTSKISLYLMYAVHAFVALLCQFAAERGSLYSSNIMTEGLTVSCWLIVMTLLIEGVLDKDIKKLILLLILLAVLTDTRKQMAVGYLTLFAAAFFAWMKKGEFKKYFKRMALLSAGIVVSVILALGGTRLYNWALRGSFAQNTRDMNLVLTTSLYVADPEDAQLIEEESVRTLFTQTMEILAESRSTYGYAPKDLRGLEEHYEENFDVITINTTGPLFVEYAQERGFAPGMEAEAEADRMSGVIVRSLLADNAGHYLAVYAASFIHGIVNTVAKRNTLLDLYAFAACIAYVVLMIAALRKKEKKDAGFAALFVLFGMLLNIAVAAALIFCQSRYMIYNMPLFYMAGLWLCEAVLTEKFKTEKK